MVAPVGRAGSARDDRRLPTPYRPDQLPPGGYLVAGTQHRRVPTTCLALSPFECKAAGDSDTGRRPQRV